MNQKEPTMNTLTGNDNESPSNQELLPHLADSKVETLSLKYTSWSGSKAEVNNEDSELLYTVEYKLRHPHLRVYDKEGTEPIAGATYHSTTSRIDIDLRGQDISMKTKSFWKSESMFTSSALHGQTMTWKIQHSGWYYKCVCLDEQNLPVGRFLADSAWGKKIGKVELLGTVADNNAAKEEVLVTALILAYYLTVITKTAVSAAAV